MKTLRFFFVINPIKSKLIFLLIFSVFFVHRTALSSPQKIPSSSPNAAKKLVVLGDSLTEGYGVSKDSAFPALLEKKIQVQHPGWTVINAGVSGSTSASAISRLKWLLKSKPDLLILCLGANDGLRGLSPAATKKNLSEAIKYAKEQKINVVLGGLYMPPNYGKKYTADFRKTFEELAKEHQVKLIHFLLEGVGGESKYNLADGIHPNEEGHKKIAENVFQSIKDLL